MLNLTSINKNIEQYGFPMHLTYNKPNFHSDKLGLMICIKNNKTGKIEENCIPTKENKDEYLQKLLNDNTINIVEYNFTALDETNELVRKTIFYMPYKVDEHSSNKPTITNTNIEFYGNAHNEGDIELLFVTSDGLYRYMTVPFSTNNIGLLELINDMFEYDNLEDSLFQNEFIEWTTDENDEEGYVIDFYDECGHKYDLTFHDNNELRNIISSMRLIRLDIIHDEK